jgi:hypothetical protein
MCTQCIVARLAEAAGGGISLRLLPKMRIVIEMDGITAPGQASQQLLTTEQTMEIAQASIAAARAAEAAVVGKQKGMVHL